MREELENKYRKALDNNDNDTLFYCIYSACKAEFIYFLKKVNKNKKLNLPKDVYCGIIMDSAIMVFKRITQGFSYNYKTPKSNIPEKLGAYCYTVVTNEYKRVLKNFLTEGELIDKLCNKTGEYNWLIGEYIDE